MDTTPPVIPNNGNNKLWSILCHLCPFIGIGVFFPLVVYLAMRDDSPFVESHARAALNFQLSTYIYVLLCIPLIFVVVGVPLMILVGVASLILSIIAAVKASNGESYQYPLTIKFVNGKQAI